MVIILTASNWKPCPSKGNPVDYLDHYCPALRKQDLGDLMFDAACDVQSDNLQQHIQSIIATYQVAMDEAKDGKQLLQKLKAQMRGKVDVLENLGALMKRMRAKRLIMWRVPADNNCGAWAGTELCKKDPALTDVPDESDLTGIFSAGHAQMMEFRAEAAETWRSNAKNKAIQNLFASTLGRVGEDNRFAAGCPGRKETKKAIRSHAAAIAKDQVWLDWVDLLVYAMERNRHVKMVCNEEGPLKVQDCIEYAQNQAAILRPESDDSCQ